MISGVFGAPRNHQKIIKINKKLPWSENQKNMKKKACPVMPFWSPLGGLGVDFPRFCWKKYFSCILSWRNLKEASSNLCCIPCWKLLRRSFGQEIEQQNMHKTRFAQTYACAYPFSCQVAVFAKQTESAALSLRQSRGRVRSESQKAFAFRRAN